MPHLIGQLAAWSPDFTFFLSRPVKGLSFTTCARVDVLQPIYYIYTYVFITWWGTTVRCGTNPAAVVCAQRGGRGEVEQACLPRCVG